MAWLPPTVFPPRPPIPMARTQRPGGYWTPPDILNGLKGGGGAFLGDALADLGYGLTQGGFDKGFEYAGQRTAQMTPLRTEADSKRREQELAVQRAKANAAFIKDPAISAAVASGNLDFKTGYEMWKSGTDAVVVNDRLVNRATGEVIADFSGGADGGGAYEGTSMDAQNWNILLSAANDPSVLSSPEYAAAYAQITQPKVTMQQTPTGLMPVMETPQIPAWLQPPTGAAASAVPGATPTLVTAGNATPGMTAPTTGNISTGGVIPGTTPKPTESQVRVGMLSKSLINEVPTVLAHFEELGDPKGQLLTMIGPVANPWQDPQYQQAAAAVAASASKILYALSGAAASDPETERIIREITPQWGEKPAAIADRKRRFETYVQSLSDASSDPQVKALAAQVLARSKAGPAGPPVPPNFASPAAQGNARKTSTGVTWSM